jgi:hypothetical protein
MTWIKTRRYHDIMPTRFGLIIAGLTILVVVGDVVAQSPGNEAGKSAVTPDTRTALDLDPAARKGLKQTMREHLEALQAIVAALGQENYERAAAMAHEELGFPKHHEAMQREQGAALPKKYQELAMAHHQAAEDLAEVIPARKMKPILQLLNQTMKACVDCHRAYKL